MCLNPDSLCLRGQEFDGAHRLELDYSSYLQFNQRSAHWPWYVVLVCCCCRGVHTNFMQSSILQYCRATFGQLLSVIHYCTAGSFLGGGEVCESATKWPGFILIFTAQALCLYVHHVYNIDTTQHSVDMHTHQASWDCRCANG